MMLQLKIEALDTFFFRDGRPFTMGADTTATGPFPPSPQVVYGAIRSAMAAQEGMKQEDIDRLTKSVKMVDFGLFTHGSRYYPAPLDILLPKSDPKNQPIGFVPTTMLGAASSCISNGGQSPDYWLYSDEFVEQVNGYHISGTELGKYLGCTEWEFPLLSPDQAFRLETKTGIGRLGFTKTVVPGHLYRVGMVRPITTIGELSQPLQIVAMLENEMDFDVTGQMLLGGEGKLASIKKVAPSPQRFPKPDANDQYFKLYLKTPAIFKNGIFPELGKTLGFALDPIAWMTGKPVRVGGFDMAKRAPKPMLTAVPAGSVYYYKLPSGVKFGEVLEKLEGQHSVSDYREDEGFGLYEFGVLPWEKLSII